LFIFVLILGCFSTLFGIPGTVIILIDAFIYALFTGFESIGGRVLITLLILSVLAELSEFVVGIAGAVRFGASKKALTASVIGGILGALLLSPLMFGLGAILGAFLGGFAGVLGVELLRQSRLKPSLRAAWGTIIGRVAGICVKGAFALVMTAISLASIYN
jgi:uncharacterized protein YqgC (DUF456 family)